MVSRMSIRNPKLALFAQFATVAKSLGHPHRLELLEQLAQGERTVEILADRTALSIANTSQHLQQMRRAGLVTNRRDGKFVFYQLADDSVLSLLAALRTIAERNLAEVERVVRSYFDDRDSLEAVSRDELLSRSRAGTVTILDLRPEDEFALGHLPGAVNIPERLKAAFLCLNPQKRLLRTAAARIACSPMKPLQRCESAGLLLAGSKTVCRNGALPASRSSLARNR